MSIIALLSPPTPTAAGDTDDAGQDNDGYAVSKQDAEGHEEADDEQQLADMMKRLGLPTEFGAAKRHKQQPPLDTAALASSASASASASTHGTDTTAVAAASPAAGRGSKAQRKRRRQQQQQQRGGLDAAQRWQRRANKPDVYDNPSYVGRLVLAAGEAGEESEQAGEVYVVWEVEAEAEAEEADEHVDDYGLTQSEELEGEVPTDAPAAAEQPVDVKSAAAAAAQAEHAGSGEQQQQQQHHHHQQQQQQQQKVDEPTTSDTAQPLSDPNLTVDVDPKYYAQRYRLFSRYDDGVRLDAVGWYSVTPEAIARHIAARIAGSLGRPFTVVDAFAGLGGNTIAFALQPLCERVVAVELDVQRLQLCRHNAAVYGVSDKCEWVQGDWLQVRQQLRQQQRSVDVVFLAPPWGGVQYGERDVYGLSELAVADGGRPLIEAAMRLAGVEGRVAVSVPRNVDVAEVVQVGCGGRVEVEYNRCNGKVKTVTAYYGGLVRAASAAADGEAQQPELAMAAAPLSFSSRCAGYR